MLRGSLFAAIAFGISSLVRLAWQITNPPTTVNMDTVVNVGTMVVFISVAVTLAVKMTRVEEAVKPLARMPERLVKMESELRHLGVDVDRIEGGVGMLENDINNLWAAFRGDPPDVVRREGRLPRRGPRGKEPRSDPEEGP